MQRVVSASSIPLSAAQVSYAGHSQPMQGMAKGREEMGGCVPGWQEGRTVGGQVRSGRQGSDPAVMPDPSLGP